MPKKPRYVPQEETKRRKKLSKDKAAIRKAEAEEKVKDQEFTLPKPDMKKLKTRGKKALEKGLKAISLVEGDKKYLKGVKFE